MRYSKMAFFLGDSLKAPSIDFTRLTLDRSQSQSLSSPNLCLRFLLSECRPVGHMLINIRSNYVEKDLMGSPYLDVRDQSIRQEEPKCSQRHVGKNLRCERGGNIKGSPGVSHQRDKQDEGG